MKWKNLTKKSGDDGKTSFQGKRKSKSSLIFDVLGEIDTLNSQLGIIADPFAEFAFLFQRMNQDIMGKLHDPKTVIQDWEDIVDQILDNITVSMDEEEIPCDGWIQYDNHMFVVCCQVRKVERLMCKYRNNATHVIDADLFIRLYNRLSKIFFCLGCKMQDAVKKINEDEGKDEGDGSDYE